MTPTPFYTLPELADRLDSFARFLARHHDFLAGCGLPPERFDGCRWLAGKLGRTYDTRMTSGPDPRPRAGPSEGGGRVAIPGPRYDWIAPPAGRAGDDTVGPPGGWPDHLPNGEADWPLCLGLPLAGEVVASCDLFEAQLLPGLSRDDALRLERLRGSFLSAKRAVVGWLAEEVRQHVPGGAPGDLVQRCVALLADSLTREDAEFLQRMDRVYLGRDFTVGPDDTGQTDQTPGGLTDLLDVVGHVEAELAAGRLAATRERLPSSLRAVIDTGPLRRLTPTQTRLLTLAAAEFNRRRGRARSRSAEFRGRAAGAVPFALNEVITVRVPREHAPLLAERVRRYAEHTLATQAAGRPATPGGPAAVPSWDRRSGELTLEGALIGEFRVRAERNPTNVVQVLDAFQHHGWPAWIKDPLTKEVRFDNPTRRYKTTESLNATIDRFIGMNGAPRAIMFLTQGLGYGFQLTAHAESG